MNTHNYNHLFYFYVTAKLNGVTVAAKHLNTSQSSLSTQIKTLELALKKPLFKKVGRRMELTDFGKETFAYCRRAFELFDEMFDQLEKKSSSMGPRVSVGVSVEVDRPFITDALARVSRQYSKSQQPRLTLTSLPAKQLAQLLDVGEIDFLLTPKADHNQDIETIASLDLPVGIFSTSRIGASYVGSPLERIISLGGLPFALPSKSTGIRQETDQFLLRKKLRPVCVFESNVISSIVRACVDGMGAVLMPYAYVSRELKSGKLLSLCKKPLWNQRMVLVANRHALEGDKSIFSERLVEQIRASVKIEFAGS